MNKDEFRAALERLGLNVASQRTGKLLGLNVRQVQRLANGDSMVPEPVALLLGMYHKYGTDERWLSVTCGRYKIDAVEVDESGIWDVNFPWGTERLQGVYTTESKLEKAVNERFKRKKENDKKRAAA